MVDGEVMIQMVISNELLQSRKYFVLPHLQARLQVYVSWRSFVQPENLDQIIQSQLGTGQNVEKRSWILRNDDHISSQCIIAERRGTAPRSQFEDNPDRMILCNETLFSYGKVFNSDG